MSKGNFRLLVVGTLFAGAVGAELTQPLWATDVEGAKKTLQDAGLTPQEVGGYAWFQSGDDTFSTKFTAISKDGRVVEGAVTHGLLFKGSTIRYK